MSGLGSVIAVLPDVNIQLEHSPKRLHYHLGWQTIYGVDSKAASTEALCARVNWLIKYQNTLHVGWDVVVWFSRSDGKLVSRHRD
jgi:hypothetical protein